MKEKLVKFCGKTLSFAPYDKKNANCQAHQKHQSNMYKLAQKIKKFIVECFNVRSGKHEFPLNKLIIVKSSRTDLPQAIKHNCAQEYRCKQKKYGLYHENIIPRSEFWRGLVCKYMYFI